jgi:hypothetical protein
VFHDAAAAAVAAAAAREEGEGGMHKMQFFTTEKRLTFGNKI